MTSLEKANMATKEVLSEIKNKGKENKIVRIKDYGERREIHE